MQHNYEKMWKEMKEKIGEIEHMTTDTRIWKAIEKALEGK